MLFPIGDTPNPRFTPWVNWALIALNVLVFLAFTLPLSQQPADPTDPLLLQYVSVLREAYPSLSAADLAQGLTAYDSFVFEHGYKPGAPSLSDLFSAMFLHAGLGHLLGNMLFLWIYGDNVEHRLGHLRYLLVYLLSGVAATLGFALLAGGSMTPLVGASGAISGALGLYFVFFPRNRVKVFVFLFPFIMRVFLVPARLVLGVYLLWDNVLPLLISGSSGGGVAYGAHIGGFVAGVLIALGVERFGIRSPIAAHAGEAPPTLPEALRSGGTDDILLALRSATPEGLAALSATELSTLAGALGRAGHADVGIWMLRRALREHRRHPGLHLAMGLLWLAEGQDATAYQHLAAAAELDPRGDAGGLARRALQQLNLYAPR